MTLYKIEIQVRGNFLDVIGSVSENLVNLLNGVVTVSTGYAVHSFDYIGNSQEGVFEIQLEKTGSEAIWIIAERIFKAYFDFLKTIGIALLGIGVWAWDGAVGVWNEIKRPGEQLWTIFLLFLLVLVGLVAISGYNAFKKPITISPKVVLV